MSDRVVVLDRDGVINNDSDQYIKSPEEWVPIPGSIEALARLHHAGYKIGVVTNQSGISRGLFSVQDLDAMHRKLRDLTAQQGARIEMIAFCPHLPSDCCSCRKPKPGLLLSVCDRLGVDPKEVTFIGDWLSDIEAARAANSRPWLVRTGKGLDALASGSTLVVNLAVFDDLADAADKLLESEVRF